MEALKRKPDLGVKKSMAFPDGTKVEIVGIRAGVVRSITQSKESDFDKGVRITAAKVRINGQEVTYDDLMECFTSDELQQIIEFANDIKKESTEAPNE